MFEGDDRGQSVQIGAILLFGILIVGLAFFQAFVVPQENKATEFDGYVEATEDLTAYYADVLAAGTQGSQAGETVRTGVRYSPRAVLINPGPPAGAVRTTGVENVTVDGVEAVSGEAGTVRGFWDTAAHGPRNYTTTGVEFAPAYNEFDASPVAVSGVGTYRLGSGGHVTLTDQPFVSGNRITLVTLDGDVNTGGLSTSLSAAPTSVATRSVAVTGAGGNDFVVTVPVPGDATMWNESAAARSVRANPNVVSTAVVGSRVAVTFDGSARYTLRLAKVTVRDRSDSGVETATEPAYLVPLDGNGTVVPYNNATTLGVEVRDRYNNPVEGATVDFSATRGSFVGGSTVTTGSDGRATVQFDIQGSDSATVEADLPTVSDSWGRSTFTVEAGAGGRADVDPTQNNDNINPGDRSEDLVWTGASKPGAKDNPVVVTLENFGQQKNVTELKLSFYNPGRKDANIDPPTSADVTGDASASLDVSGSFQPYGEVFAAGESDTLAFQFKNPDGSDFEPDPRDFFIVNARVDNDGDGVADESNTYFISY
jgi:hypothetical protein